MQIHETYYYQGLWAGQCTLDMLSTDGILARVTIQRGEHVSQFVVYSADLLEAPTEPPAPKLGLQWYQQHRRLIRPERIQPPLAFQPTILWDERWPAQDGFAILQMAVRLKQCPDCGTLMVPLRWRSHLTDTVLSDLHWTDNGQRCMECEKQRSMTCLLCGQQVPRAGWRTYGENGCLCKVCYQSVPAVTWDEAAQRLHNTADDDDNNWF